MGFEMDVPSRLNLSFLFGVNTNNSTRYKIFHYLQEIYAAMRFQDDPDTIRWRLHLTSPVSTVYRALATDAGRAGFWAESAVERDGVIHFVFPNGVRWDGRVLQAQPPYRYEVQYFGNSVAAFTLEEDGRGGADLTLTDTGVPPQDRTEVIAGWVSVLMALKAAVDFGVDLRAHDPERHWDTGYVEN
jgi:uncharacterized protein YndB with AHSA1/START domain